MAVKYGIASKEDEFNDHISPEAKKCRDKTTVSD
jgi:hypothetical protein